MWTSLFGLLQSTLDFVKTLVGRGKEPAATSPTEDADPTAARAGTAAGAAAAAAAKAARKG